MNETKDSKLTWVSDHGGFQVFTGNPEGGSKGLVFGWTKGVQFEEPARQQVANISMMPFIHKHVAVMPDVHAGKGATVGSVIATRGAIIPAAVGVDIGCGMMAVKTNLKANDLPDSLAGMRSAIEQAVPHGGPGDIGAWPQDGISLHAIMRANRLSERYGDIVSKYPKVESPFVGRQMGTLGTGNHFVEVCLDKDQNVWVMLHSGSRGPGNRIGTVFIEAAKEEMRRWFINLPDQDLAYLPEGSELFEDYIEAVDWAQEYAVANREVMMQATLKAIGDHLERHVQGSEQAVNCHHNYVSRENHFGANVLVTRKGAVSARKGQLGIIPGSMGARSYIVQGLGNPDSFTSCSHGAGRAMSRGEAKRRFSTDDLAAQTAGVECRKDADVIDELPAAYKDLDAVMAAQQDLVKVVAVLKQVLCVKG